MKTRQSIIPRGPLAMMCGGLFLSAAPLAGHAPLFAFIGFAFAIIFRLAVDRFRFRLPKLRTKLALLAVGVAAVAATKSSIIGLEAGIGILLILSALKILETNTARDMQALAMVGWFLGLCQLFYAQDLGVWIYVTVSVLLIATSLIWLHGQKRTLGWRRPLKFACVLFAQAIPIVALLFLFAPRFYGSFRFSLSRGMVGMTGMSDHLDPGSVASMLDNEDVAFRADFPESQIPSISDMYWRGVVLWRCEGLTWTRVTGLRLGQPKLAGGPVIKQGITLQPHGGRWLFALDRPIGGTRDATLEPGNMLLHSRAVNFPIHYQVVSKPENYETKIPDDHKREALRLPAKEWPRIQDLVAQLRQDAPDDEAFVRRVERWFRDEKFSYTLQPGTYGPEGLEEFLFERRVGFCEHYAAGFASIMRVANIPSRVILGYHGGEFNPRGKYVIVRQRDAHAWCEVHLAGAGWQRVDPVKSIAPERIAAGISTFRENLKEEAELSKRLKELGLSDLWNETRLTWDNLNHQWNLRVINFTPDEQFNFFALVGVEKFPWMWLLVAVGALICFILWVLLYWIARHQPTRREIELRAYDIFCAKLAAAGVERAESEGPKDFSDRAATELPHSASEIRLLAQRYTAIRYGAHAESPKHLLQAVKRFRVMRSAPRSD